MPKILRIVNRFNLGGPVFNAAYLTKYLSPEYETLLVGGEKEPHEDSSTYVLDNLGVDYLVLPEMKRPVSLGDDYRAYKTICRIIREFRPDIIHTHASKAGLIGRLAAKKTGVPIVVHTYHGHVFHSYFGKLKTTIFTAFERYLSTQTTKIIAISQQQKEEIAHYLKLEKQDSKIAVVQLGIDTDKFIPSRHWNEHRNHFRAQWKISQEAVAVGIIGRLVSIKNHTLFFDAFAEVLQHTTRKIVAVVVGDGDLRMALQQYAKHLGLTVSLPEMPVPNADIVFTSWIRQVETVYPALDIVALTSFNEGTPVSLIEAQVAEKLVVSTNVGGVRDVIPQKNQDKLLSPSGNVKEFAQNLRYWIEHDDERQTVVAENAPIIHQQFHYNRLVNDIKELYRDLLRR